MAFPSSMSVATATTAATAQQPQQQQQQQQQQQHLGGSKKNKFKCRFSKEGGGCTKKGREGMDDNLYNAKYVAYVTAFIV